LKAAPAIGKAPAMLIIMYENHQAVDFAVGGGPGSGQLLLNEPQSLELLGRCLWRRAFSAGSLSILRTKESHRVLPLLHGWPVPLPLASLPTCQCVPGQCAPSRPRRVK